MWLSKDEYQMIRELRDSHGFLLHGCWFFPGGQTADIKNPAEAG
jgi:hypothetical protein